MSIEALNWAFSEAPGVRKCCVPVLLGLANHARPNGKGAFPSRKLLAHYSRKSIRATQDCLGHLMEDGLIARGDQRHNAWIPSDRRPVVYNLAMHLRMELPADLHADAEPQSGKPTIVPDPDAPAEEPEGEPEAPAQPKPKPGNVTGLAAFKAARTKLGHKGAGAANPPNSYAAQCPKHRGQLAAFCAPCKSEALGEL
ncbi:hypothetical protein [Micromonospora sp. NPDC048839]|uniref:hypothetical protein n=1 Tax=Micromonospora sp. NPDC048839 TaxID=3155641 RepID=UPI00340A6976